MTLPSISLLSAPARLVSPARFLSSAACAALALGALTAQPAAAACSGSAGLYSCTGSDGDGLNIGNGSNAATITVETGASVSNPGGDALRARGSNNTVINHGTIAGTAPDGSDGIDGGHGLSVQNFGTITATNKGVDAEAKNDFALENHGTIHAVDKAVRNADGNNAYLYNAVGASIISDLDEGFETGDNARVINYGTISASDDAVQLGENALIDNYGLIESRLRGAQDANDPQDGIDIDSGTINNHAGAVIRSDDDAAIDYDGSDITSYINNWGTIAGTKGVLVETGLDAAGNPNGELANTARQVITNHGVIAGSQGTALLLGQGHDQIFAMAGSQVLGDVLMGADDDTITFAADFDGLFDGLLDGGTGFDTLEFLGLGFADLRAVTREGTAFALGFDSFSLLLSGWESLVFTDGSYAMADIAALAAVPLPGGLVLMLGGVGMLAGLRKRRRA